MANGYSVGNLELDIAAIDKSATSLSNVINRLDSMLSLITPISTGLKALRNDMSAISRLKFGSFDRLASGLNGISKVNTQGLYTKLNSVMRIFTPLQELGGSLKDVGQLNNFANGLQKIVKLDVGTFDTKIKSLTASLTPFLKEITLATPALNAFSAAMTPLKGRRTINFKWLNAMGDDGLSAPKKGKHAIDWKSTIGKLYVISNYTKRLRSYVFSMLTNAIDYTETLNLWQVAMRDNVSTAEEFITKMNKAYGIATQTLMQYQATFKNMLSSLGGISSEVSYALSEYLTQMALDYASLYNTSIDKAMTVFQSFLSGQVRPIRSISGYDITETTIYQLYQQLGGTKTMRQLTQTEKRLLRIYAVFQQMDRSGAIGDLSKTLNNTANQLRVMSESVKELGTWIGKLVEMYIAPALPYINAFLITATNIAKAIVKSLPKYSEFDGTIKGYEDTAEVMDEVQGKLLDFDKFRSLSGAEEDNLGVGIDEKLIAGLTQYQSILENVSNKAAELAKKWTSWWVDDETGELTDKAKTLLSVLKALAITVGGLLALGIGKKLIALLGSITGIKTSVQLLNVVLATGIIASFTRAIELFKEGNVWGGILATTLGVILVSAFIKLNKQAILTLWQSIGKKLIPALTGLVMHFGGVKQMLYSVGIAAGTFSLALMGGLAILMLIPQNRQKVVGAVMAIAGAVIALTAALIAYKTAVSWGTMLPVLTAGVGVALAGGLAWSGQLDKIANNVQVRKTGGAIEDGLFTMNKGEVMGTFDDGTSIVANNQQIISGIKQGVYQAVSQAMKNNSHTDDRPIEVVIDGEKVFQVTKRNAQRHGLSFSKKG